MGLCVVWYDGAGCDMSCGVSGRGVVRYGGVRYGMAGCGMVCWGVTGR